MYMFSLALGCTTLGQSQRVEQTSPTPARLQRLQSLLFLRTYLVLPILLLQRTAMLHLQSAFGSISGFSRSARMLLLDNNPDTGSM